MRTKIYSLIAIATIALAATNAEAQTWRPKNLGLPTSFYAASVYGDGTNIMVANSSPAPGTQMFYAPDSSTNYTASTSSLGLYAAVETKVVKAHGKHFVGGIGGVFKSSDNGVTWAITGASSDKYTYALHASADTIYANMGDTTQLPYYSTDDGASWTLIPNYTGTMIMKMLRHNGVLYAGGSSSFQYTTDMGATWQTVSNTSLSAQNINGLVLFQGDVYASCIVGVFKSSDNGATWTNVTTTPMNCMEAVDTSLICGTPTNGVTRSDKSVTNWTPLTAGLALYISTLHYTISNVTFNNDYVIVSAATDPNAIYVMGMNELGLTAPPPPVTAVSQIAKEPLSFELFPNPASTEVAIQTGASKAAVSLIDATGRIIKHITTDNANTFKLDISKVPSGLYFVQLNIAGKIATEKLEVLH